MGPQNKKNQVKHGKYGSIVPPQISLERHNSQVLPLVTRGPLPHVLKSIHKICLHSTQLYGVLKNSKGGGSITQISQEEKPGTIFAGPFKKGPLSFSLAQQRIYESTYLKKRFWFVLLFPFLHRQSRKRMRNTLLIIFICM